MKQEKHSSQYVLFIFYFFLFFKLAIYSLELTVSFPGSLFPFEPLSFFYPQLVHSHLTHAGNNHFYVKTTKIMVNYCYYCHNINAF